MAKTPRNNKPIEELAFAFLNGKYRMKGIINKFGWAQAMAATTQMADTILLCDPNHQRAKRFRSMGRRDLLK